MEVVKSKAIEGVDGCLALGLMLCDDCVCGRKIVVGNMRGSHKYSRLWPERPIFCRSLAVNSTMKLSPVLA
jgi:hypothetical protein